VDRSDTDFRLRAVPAAVFVDLLREAGGTLSARDLKHRLQARGVSRDVVDAAWRRAQPGVRRHANVVFDQAHSTYLWSDTPAPLPAFTPATALEHLLSPAGSDRAEAAEVIRAALGERDRLMAMAAQVEAMLLAGADARIVIERVRQLTGDARTGDARTGDARTLVAPVA
jgi:hypothetical protein